MFRDISQVPFAISRPSPAATPTTGRAKPPDVIGHGGWQPNRSAFRFEAAPAPGAPASNHLPGAQHPATEDAGDTLLRLRLAEIEVKKQEKTRMLIADQERLAERREKVVREERLREEVRLAAERQQNETRALKIQESQAAQAAEQSRLARLREENKASRLTLLAIKYHDHPPCPMREEEQVALEVQKLRYEAEWAQTTLRIQEVTAWPWTCQVCTANPSVYALVPCGHMALCRDCARSDFIKPDRASASTCAARQEEEEEDALLRDEGEEQPEVHENGHRHEESGGEHGAYDNYDANDDGTVRRFRFESSSQSATARRPSSVDAATTVDDGPVIGAPVETYIPADRCQGSCPLCRQRIQALLRIFVDGIEAPHLE